VHVDVSDDARFSVTIRAPASCDWAGQYTAHSLVRQLYIVAPEVRTEVRLFVTDPADVELLDWAIGKRRR
jgi:hypothetical protein